MRTCKCKRQTQSINLSLLAMYMYVQCVCCLYVRIYIYLHTDAYYFRFYFIPNGAPNSAKNKIHKTHTCMHTETHVGFVHTRLSTQQPETRLIESQ